MRIDFLGKKWVMFAISGVAIAISIGALLVRGLSFGIEFSGGTAIDLTMEKSLTAGEVREVLAPLGLGDAVIQPAENNTLIIRMKSLSPAEQKELITALDKEFGVKETNSVQTVGPGWGENVTNGALQALAISIFSILVYISLRFEYKMALTAVAALVHDVLITIGVYALVGRSVTPNTIAALLTILGYSLYDTIVVFHRIRDNSGRIGKRTFEQMANDSINQVLMRSINTSLTSIIPVTALLLLGGETLKDFAFALFVGIVSGTYSSIGVASPLYSLWKETEPKYRNLKKKYATRAA